MRNLCLLQWEEHCYTTNRHLLPGLLSSSQQHQEASPIKKLPVMFHSSAEQLSCLQNGSQLWMLQRPCPYPAQSLQQEGLETITPCNQIFLQLLIIQRGQQWHILYLPKRKRKRHSSKPSLLIQCSWCYWGEKRQNRKSASGKELPHFHIFITSITIIVLEQQTC